MNHVAEKQAEYADLFDLPEGTVGEILYGQLYTHPRPAPRHANAISGLGFEVGGPYHRGRGGPGGWWILDEPELHLGQQILVPDLAGWRRERMPELPSTAGFDLAPDWVCEVLSPSTQRTDRALKMPIYAEQGVQWLWLVDPDAQILEAYELNDGHWRLLATLSDDQPVSQPPFDATAFALDLLWR